MSPASAGGLQVEQYIGACLITQNRPKNLKSRPDFYGNNAYQQAYGQYQHDGWAGGVPLISFANHQRRNGTNRKINDYDESCYQGAPLIVTKSYQHRKNKPLRTDNNIQQTKIFENSNHKKHLQEVIESNNKNVDAISVTSDESQNSVEMCLPRIIKPRKRRKKDRKPPHLRIQNEYNNNNAPMDSPVHFSAYNPNTVTLENNTFKCGSNKKVPEAVNPIFELFNDTPKLDHNFEDVKEDLNGNQPSVNCQCRYCNPSGHNIWDVERDCYSPFLTAPKDVFDFTNLESVLSNVSLNSLEHSFSNSLDDDARSRSSFSRSWSSSSGSSDLEVSTEIVTSLNGHRDLEIKFFNPSLVENKNCVRNNNNNNSFLTNINNNSGANFFSFSIVSSADNAKEREGNSVRFEDGLSEQNTSFFSNGTISF